MKLFLLILLCTFQLNSFADCSYQLGNLTYGRKLYGIIVDRVYSSNSPYKGKIPDNKTICEDTIILSKDASVLDVEHMQDLKLSSLMHQDIQRGGKAKKVFINGLIDSDAPSDMSEKEVCGLVDSLIEKESSETLPADLLREISKIEFLGSDVTGCKKMMGPLRKFWDAKIAKAKGENEWHREPPGEEISPAEEPVQKSVFKETGVPQKTEAIQPARTKSHTSSGSAASSQ